MHVVNQNNQDTGIKVRIYCEGKPDSVQGRLRRSPAGVMVLQSETYLLSDDLPEVGQRLRIIYPDATQFRVISAFVCQTEPGQVLARPVNSYQGPERRHDQRFPCRIPICVRAIQASGHFGPWLEAMMIDISAGGALIETDLLETFPRRVELMVPLQSGRPGVLRSFDDAGTLLMSDTLGQGSFKLTASVRGVSFSQEGRLRVHTQFTALSSQANSLLREMIAGLDRAT